jgi:2-polyprenyl-6-hydroxyphenyl methylase/3-demethylubiquinone-9 3-methyltransferase
MPKRDANVDPSELAKFEALAARWWDPKGVFKSLHDINPLRLNYIRQRVALQGKRVLDIGCGGGILSEAMAALGAAVTGIDLGEAPLTVAKHHLRDSKLDIDYRQISAESLAKSPIDRFDIVACLEMLEHVPDPSSVVHACKTLVKPGGDVFFATINRNPKSFLLAILGAEYILGLLPKGTHNYARFIKPSEMNNWAGKVGLALQNFAGMHYNPITQKYSLGGNLHVNYLAHFRRRKLYRNAEPA